MMTNKAEDFKIARTSLTTPGSEIVLSRLNSKLTGTISELPGTVP